MKNLLGTLLFFISFGIASAQFEKNYVAMPVQDTIPATILGTLKTKTEKDKAGVQEPKGAVKEFIYSIYDKRLNYLVRNFNEDYFIVDHELSLYLQSILNAIYQANPALPQEAKVYPFRSGAPNATSFGDGTIAFTLGLLTKLENEDQVAFALCHELAHYHYRHSENVIAEVARLNFDKELKKKMKDIRQSEYGRVSKLNELVGSVGFSMNHHSREKEFEADSLGLALYLNTKYNRYAPIRLMEILDSVDISSDQHVIDLKKYFNFREYPFKSAWIAYTKSDTWYSTMDEKKSDSLSTHPACKKRSLALNRQLKTYHPTPSSVKDKKFQYFRSACSFELIESDYHFKQYGRALFRTLMLMETFPRNAYLHAMVSKCLYRLYEYQKNHELDKALDLPDPRFDENYDRFLTFIHTLRLQELSSLAYHYITSQKEEYFSNEEYIYALWLCSQLDISKVDPEKIKMEYVAKFPSGKYTKQIH